MTVIIGLDCRIYGDGIRIISSLGPSEAFVLSALALKASGRGEGLGWSRLVIGLTEERSQVPVAMLGVVNGSGEGCHFYALSSLQIAVQEISPSGKVGPVQVRVIVAWSAVKVPAPL